MSNKCKQADKHEAIRTERAVGDAIVDVISYTLTDSTNARALEYARCEKPSRPTVFIAREQTAGRGRLGRSFLSPNGGIYMTILTKTLPGCDFLSVTTYAATVIARVVENITGLDAKIKWVNDIYVGERKLAGILTQGAVDPDTGTVAYVAMGVGINVLGKELPDEISEIATTLEREGAAVDIDTLAHTIIDKYISELHRAGDKAVAEEYRSRSMLIEECVTVIKPDESYVATVEGITDRCELILKLPSGQREMLMTGEVSVRKNHS